MLPNDVSPAQKVLEQFATLCTAGRKACFFLPTPAHFLLQQDSEREVAGGQNRDGKKGIGWGLGSRGFGLV